MKKIKYIIYFLLVFLGFIITGEIFQDYLNSFESQSDYTTLYADKGVSHNEMLVDIENAAEKNNVEVFFVKRENSSVFSASIEVFTTSKKVDDYIKENYQVYQGRFKSLFSGTTEINFHNISQVSDITKVNYFYLIGDSENQVNFKLELVDKYAGSIPRDGAILTQAKTNIIAIWCLVSVLILLLSYYQVVSSRKEVLLKILYGESTITIILKGIISDILVISALSFVAYNLSSLFSYSRFYIKVSLLMLVAIILANSMIYLLLLRLNIRRDFSKVKYNSKVL